MRNDGQEIWTKRRNIRLCNAERCRTKAVRTIVHCNKIIPYYKRQDQGSYPDEGDKGQIWFVIFNVKPQRESTKDV